MSEDHAAVEESEPDSGASADAGPVDDPDSADSDGADAAGGSVDADGDVVDDAASAVSDAAEADGETTGDVADADEGTPSVETLVTRIAAHDEALAGAAHELGDRIDSLEADLAAKEAETETLTEKLTRARADFTNYKKRAKKQQEETRARATEDLVERLTSVRDNLVRALDQDADADIRPGVEATLEEFDRVLEAENVTFITPAVGDEVDPERHEVMLRVDSDQPAGTIADVYQPGYEMAGKVIQPAQVTVSSDDA